jgi:hypothetical protein
VGSLALEQFPGNRNPAAPTTRRIARDFRLSRRRRSFRPLVQLQGHRVSALALGFIEGIVSCAQ